MEKLSSEDEAIIDALVDKPHKLDLKLSDRQNRRIVIKKAYIEGMKRERGKK